MLQKWDGWPFIHTFHLWSTSSSPDTHTLAHTKFGHVANLLLKTTSTSIYKTVCHFHCEIVVSDVVEERGSHRPLTTACTHTNSVCVCVGAQRLVVVDDCVLCTYRLGFKGALPSFFDSVGKRAYHPHEQSAFFLNGNFQRKRHWGEGMPRERDLFLLHILIHWFIFFLRWILHHCPYN